MYPCISPKWRVDWNMKHQNKSILPLDCTKMHHSQPCLFQNFSGDIPPVTRLVTTYYRWSKDSFCNPPFISVWFRVRLIWLIEVILNRNPANTRRCTNADLMLAQSRRLWANIGSTLVQRLVYAVNMVHQPSTCGSVVELQTECCISPYNTEICL